jgi:hypothetical protein
MSNRPNDISLEDPVPAGAGNNTPPRRDSKPAVNDPNDLDAQNPAGSSLAKPKPVEDQKNDSQ